MHYSRWRKHGDIFYRDGIYQRGRPETCAVEGCERPYKARGYCGLHYQRFMDHGDVHRESRRPNGQGTIDRYGYVRIGVDPGTPNAYEFIDRSDDRNRRRAWIHEHRLVMARHLGRPLLPGESVHHKNGDRQDNRLENLELWVSHQPSGQRPADLLAWAHEIIDRYEEQGASEQTESASH